MAKSAGARPLISGGRTLSRMLGGGKSNSGKSKQSKKAVWFEAFGITYNAPGVLGAWPTGCPPAWIQAGLERRK